MADPRGDATADPVRTAPFPAAWVGELVRSLGSASIGIWYLPDVSTDEMWWSQSLYDMTGYTPDELPARPQSCLSLAAAEDREGMTARLANLKSMQEGGSYDSEFRMRSKDGTLHWYRCLVSIVPNPLTRSAAAVGMMRRIDGDRLNTRSELNLIQRALDVVLESIGFPVVLVTAAGRILQANAAAGLVLGRPSSLLPGRPLCELFPERADAPEFERNIREVATSGRTKRTRIHQNGRCWQIDLAPLHDDRTDVTRVAVLAQDITSLQSEHEQLLERERELAATLVREVNHRIKNHLQAVVGLLRRAVARRAPVGETIDLAVTQVLAIATVHDLLSQHGPSRVTIRELADGILTLTRNSAAIPIRLEPGTDEEICLSPVVSVPVALALAELLTNAIKHTTPDPDARIAIRWTALDSKLAVEIVNQPATLAPDAERGRAYGGIALARGLLARLPATLTLTQVGPAVAARITFGAGAWTIR